MTGGVLSSTKMVCAHVPVFPQSSVAIHVRVMVLSCGQAPATVTSENVIVRTGSQLSVAVAVPVLAGNVLAVHCTVIFAGHVTTGATLSMMVKVCVQV
jgi:hypothetical protein